MKIERVHQLTQTELDAVKGTPLYAELVARKFSVTLPSTSSSIGALQQGKDLAEFVEMHMTGPWYVCVEMRDSKFNQYTYYFSNNEDACFFEKNTLKYTS